MMVQNQNLETTKKTEEVGAMMEAQNVELFDQPIIISPIIVEKYKEKIVDGVEIEIEKKKDHFGEYYDVKFNQYVIRIHDYTPYDARMVIWSLLRCEKRLLSEGYVEGVINWEEEDWEIWDPYRLFTKGEFKIFRHGNYEMKEGDSLIDLEIRRIVAPYDENKLKIYVKAFIMPAPHIE